MNKESDNTFECESCGGMFRIEADTDEEIKHCPQCGNNDKGFKLTIMDERYE